MKEVETLKESVKTRQELPSQSQQSLPYLSAASDVRNQVGSAVHQQDRAGDHSKNVFDICNQARRTIGFTPIEPRMLELQMQSFGAKTMEEAKLMEIQSYLKCEMKVQPSEIEKLKIVRIFYPAKEDKNTLYVEFESEFEVHKLFRYTKVMVKSDHRLVHWFPKELFERYSALEKVAHDMREEMKLEGVKLRTRVKVGRHDLEFSTKMPNSSVWRNQPLPNNLPQIDLDPNTSPTNSSSPPPGRPGRSEMLASAIGAILANDKAIEAAKSAQSKANEERKRQLSDSDDEGSVKRPKGNLQTEDGTAHNDGDSSLQDENMKNTNETSAVGTSKEVSEPREDVVALACDPGKFINQEAYSPSSPAKTKIIPDLSVILNSPVYHSKTVRNLK